MSPEDVGYGAAVGNNVALEPPILAQVFLQQSIAGASGLPVHRVVGAHHGSRLGLHDGGSEGGQICVLHVMVRYGHVNAVSRGLWAAVDSKVFWRGNGLEVFRIVALKAGNEGDTDA